MRRRGPVQSPRLRLASLLAELRSPNQSLAILRSVRKQLPRNLTATLLEGRVLDIFFGDQDAVTQAYERGAKQGSYEARLRLFLEAGTDAPASFAKTTVYPRDPREALFAAYASVCLRERTRARKIAVAGLRRCRKTERDDDSVLASLLFLAGRERDAALFLRHASRKPSIFKLDAYLMLARIETQYGDPAAAIRALRGIPRYASHPTLKVLLGGALIASGNPREGLAVLERAADDSPESGTAYYNLAVAHRATGEYEKALRCVETVLRLEGDTVDALYLNGNTLRSLGRFEDAVIKYEASLRLEPTSLNAINNMGLTLSDLDRFDEAEEVLRTGLTHWPNDPDLNRNLGQVLDLLGRTKESISAYENAAMCGVTDPKMWEVLAELYEEEGLDERAAEARGRADRRRAPEAERGLLPVTW